MPEASLTFNNQQEYRSSTNKWSSSKFVDCNNQDKVAELHWCLGIPRNTQLFLHQTKYTSNIYTCFLLCTSCPNILIQSIDHILTIYMYMIGLWLIRLRFCFCIDLASRSNYMKQIIHKNETFSKHEWKIYFRVPET